MVILKRLSFVLFLTVCCTSIIFAETKLEDLTQNQIINGFKTISLYENANGDAMGARFVSDKYGFIVDYLQIESVPQAFFWVKSPPTSSKGEPHACEHLLLGKGNRGRYVAAMEDMALSSSTAYTAQTRTCYHFNTIAGADTFYEIFEAKLQALLHPDFTDEEIRREVCHIGVNVDQETGELSIDEKGTVYTEMVSSFEKPWYYSYGTLNKLVYGEGHPLVNNSGGDPDVMRSMVPSDMWKFIKDTHFLGNIGSIVSMPSNVPLEAFLISMNQILENCKVSETPNNKPSIRVQNLPPANGAEYGTSTITSYPSENEADPGYIMYAYPPTLSLSQNEEMLLSLFLETFASGETSNLYNLFINSESKKIDIGGNYVYGGYDNDLDISVYFGLGGVNSDAISIEKMAEIKKMITDEMNKIKEFAPGSEELLAFNERVKGRLIQSKKQNENYLNSPPMFGFRRGSAGGWVSLLLEVERQNSFRKSLVLKDVYAFIENELNTTANIWTKRISDWRLLSTEPYAVGTIPSKEILVKNQKEKEARLAQYIDGFKEQYGVTDAQQAIARYKEEFDVNTAKLEASASKDKLPGFIDNPPMTLDDQLNYEQILLNNKINLTASTFENMSASSIGISLRMDVIPESLLVYAPLLPEILTSIGVVKDGEVVPFDKMSERLRKEVLGLYASFDTGSETDRIELTLTGRGSNLNELHNVIDWMYASINAPYLSLDNLSRINDVIDQSLISYRNRTKGSEEGWVRDPSEAYRFQNNPLYLSTNSFLTETHHFGRLKWMLTDPGNESQQQELKKQIDLLKEGGQGKDREGLKAFLSSYEIMESPDNKENTGKIMPDIVKFLQMTLADIPDANLNTDYTYLCTEIKNDLMKKPEQALTDLQHILALLKKSDNARMYIVSNSQDRKQTIDKLNSFIGILDDTPSIYQKYSSVENIVERLKSREQLEKKPLYSGLMFDGTRNGVLIFSAKNTEKFDTSEEALLKTLSGKLYTGYGPHGLFMKTWAAGLAYSNGYRMSETTGRATYYAERCPDVAETMRFVVKELQEAEADSGLADYTIAQVFGSSRAPDRYESRGAAIADDIADGITADKISAYRKHILDIRTKKDFYSEIKSRMEDAYGSVLIGYGQPLAESVEGNFFLIGPETQFKSLEKYIKETEGEQTVYRLYPRDYWLTNRQ